MFKVTTINLAEDACRASAQFASIDRGDQTAGQLQALLENFRSLDSLQNHEAEPQVIVTARAGKFIVRSSGGRLFLYEARDTTRGCTELTAAEIVAQVDLPVPTAGPLAEEEEPVAPKRRRIPGSISLAMLGTGLLLNGYTLYSAFYIDDVNRRPPLKLLTAKTEIAEQQEAISGIFATGSEAGDRRITIGVAGTVQFHVLSSRTALQALNTDDYQLGRRDQKLFLATARSGQIAVVNRDTLVYFGDTYRRTR